MSSAPEKPIRQKSLSAKIAAVASTILWLLGFALAFVITSGPYIWIPDTLLLLGFCPLLWVWRPGWPWIVFGILNVLIGFFLELMVFIPDASFTQEMKAVRKHLAEQHFPLAWILIGFASVAIGVIRTGRDIFVWLRNKVSKK